jgi:hypothetical protein
MAMIWDTAAHSKTAYHCVEICEDLFSALAAPWSKKTFFAGPEN